MLSTVQLAQKLRFERHSPVYLVGTLPCRCVPAKRIEQAFNKPDGWLDVQHSDLEQTEVAEAPGAKLVTVEEDLAPAMVAIRMVPEHLRAGITGFESDHLFEDGGHLHVPRQWLEENDLSPDQLRAIKIKGNSMVPMMYAGDVAVVNIKDTTE